MDIEMIYGECAERDQLDDCIRDYNAPKFGDFEKLAFLCRDDGRLIGGATVLRFASCLYLDVLHIDEAYRKSGLGGRLVAMVEDYARENGIPRIFLFTYGFQAPGFYKKLGYECIAHIPDYIEGHELFYFRKEL